MGKVTVTFLSMECTPLNTAMPLSNAQITYIGHATLFIEQEGVRVLTDPILRNRIFFLRRRFPLQLPPKTLQGIDAVLISHLHYDHLDLLSLRRLGLQCRLIVPAGSASWLRRFGFSQVEELHVGETTTAGPLTITATPALHPTSRHPFGPRIESCLGYLLRGRQSIYFAGDTDLFPEMANLTPVLDLALLPVWGWGPTVGEGQGHMDPLRAAQALQLLKPRYAIPIHWGTLYPISLYTSLPNFLTQPPEDFAAFAAEYAPDVTVEIVQPGGSWSLPE
jgi:L-ascorbate metabolism protein UlaG (beta-lactamase superfamily)